MDTETYPNRSHELRRDGSRPIVGAGQTEAIVIGLTLALGIGLGVAFGSFLVGFGVVIVLAALALLAALLFR